MRIAIVDDDAHERSLLHSRLAAAEAEAEIREYCSGGAFLDDSKQMPFQVAFLDIYMPGQDGMQTARLLRQFDGDCLLIFTTTSTDHALEGFQVRAMHYLVKPFTEEELEQLTDEILAKVPHPEKYMDLKVNGSNIRLGYRDILYAEHFAHMIYIHTPSGKPLATRQAFKAFIEPLKKDRRFFICGRGVIVNLEHAEDFEGNAFRMDNGSSVYVSQELLKNARQAFMKFLLQRGRIS